MEQEIIRGGLATERVEDGTSEFWLGIKIPMTLII